MDKAAKVYEAAESVTGMQPKITYESHKKCTPHEFGMRVKEAMTDLGRVVAAIPYDASVLGAAGAGIGAAASGKGNRFRGAGRGAARGIGLGVGGNAGAVLGALAGAGLSEVLPGDEPHRNTARQLLTLGGGGLGLAGGLYGGYRAGGAIGDAVMGDGKKKEEAPEEKAAAQPNLWPVNLTGEDPAKYDSSYYIDNYAGKPGGGQFGAGAESLGRMFGSVLGHTANLTGQAGTGIAQALSSRKSPAGLGQYTASMLGNILLNQRQSQLRQLDAADTAAYKNFKAHLSKPPMLEKANAYAFGKRAASMLSALGNGAGLGGLTGSSIGAGAGLGGLAGAAAGLVAPGTEPEYDENGQQIGTRRRSRLSAALRGGLGGAALGAVGGAAYPHVAPGIAQLAAKAQAALPVTEINRRVLPAAAIEGVTA